MLTVTESALDRMSRRLARKEAADGVALRFTRREGGWKLRLDQESAGDTAFTRDGRTVLVLDKAASEAMANMTLGIGKRGDRSRFRLRRNESSKD
jgi:Fe-S cluster assembly iron-binding protein IscA